MGGIRLLGQIMAANADDSTGGAVASILEAETGKQIRYRFVRDMIKGARLDDAFNEILARVKKLGQGFKEGFPRNLSE